MSYMKRLLESVELVKCDTLMSQILDNACPYNIYESDIWGTVKVFRISLHCFEFVVDCVQDNCDWIIIKTEKETN